MASTVSQTASLIRALPHASRRDLLWKASLVLLALSLLGFALLPTQPDNDLWGHLRVGLDILQARAAPQADAYAYTHSGGLTVDHEWLGEAFAALAWTAAGAAGLVFLKISIALLTGVLCFYHLLRSRASSGRAGVVLLMLIGLVPPFMMFRPLLFSIPAFALTLIAVHQAESGRLAAVWMLPPLYVVWANLHGGFLAGLAILCIWGAMRLALDRRNVVAIVVPLSAAFAATLLNPYGWKLLTFLFRTATVPRPEIIEWVPLSATSPYGVIYVATLAAAVAGLVWSRLEKRWPLIGLFGVTSLLPFAATRHTPLAVIAAVILAGPHVADALKGMLERSQPADRGSSGDFPDWAFLLPLLGVAMLGFAAVHRPIAIPVEGEKYPVQAVRVLAASGVEGNLVNQFNWGEYILWHLGPRVKVMMDGRREWVYSEETYQRYLNFQNGSGDWDRLLRDYRADVALLGKDSTSENLLRLKTEWQQVYDDGVAVILVRSGTAVADRVAKAAAEFSPVAGPFYFP